MHPITFFTFLLTTTSFLPTPSLSATVDSFIYGGCSQLKYPPSSPFESNLNSLLTSLVNSASFTLYTNFTVQQAGPPPLYGLFQCRGDLSNSDCFTCVSRAVSQLGTLCLDSTGGALQLEGCLVKYDNQTFLGVEDKTLVLKKCGPSVAFDSTELTRRDAVLDYLGAGDGSGAYKAYRVGGSGDVYALAQCVQDLSFGQCQDCLGEAIGRLKTECGASPWGDVFLAKCYVRFSIGGRSGSTSAGGGGDNGNGNDNNNNGDEVEKTLAILIGLIAVVALLILFISFFAKVCEKAGKGGK